MPLILLPLPENHLSALGTIIGNSFRDAKDPNHLFMYPSGWSSAAGEAYLEHQLEAYHNLRNMVFLGVYEIAPDTPSPDKADDLPPETLVCGARIRLEDPSTFTEPAKKRNPPAGSNVEACKAFYAMLGSGRKDMMGATTYWHLELLVTATQHQRRGAAKLVLDWLVDRAGKTKAEETGVVGVDLFLEATPSGKPVYERVGWEHRKFLGLKGSDYGSDCDAQLWIMTRSAEKNRLESQRATGSDA